MKPTVIAAIAVLMVLRAAAAASAGRPLLAAGTSARVSVVLPADSAPLVKAAAQDLARCLGVAIGANVPMVAAQAEARTPLTIVVGPHDGIDVSGLARDGCVLKTVGSRLIITGKTAPGISNGVYTFLIEQVGVRWFIPDPLYEVIPHRPGIVWPQLDYRRNPDFRYRMMPGVPAPAGPEWERRNRLEPDQGGITRYNFGHAMAGIITAAKYGKTHPEYFAMMDGVRKVPKYDWAVNPCFTNPDVARIVAEAAHAFYRANPTIDTFAVTINDSSDFCHCPACQKLDAGLPPSQSGGVAFSESYFHFVDAVAKLVQKSDPGKYIGCLAYWGVYPVPRYIDRLPDNVVMLLTQDSSQQHDPRYAKSERALWIAWHHKVRSLGRYDYYELGWLSPRTYPHVAAADLKFIKAHGCDGFLAPMCPEWCVLGPHLYMASRLLWDTSLKPDALLGEYYRDLFGTAAPEMKRYYDDLERYWMQPRPPHWFEGLAGNTSEFTIVNGPLIEDAWRSLGKAETAASGVELQRVRDVKDHFRLTYLLVKMQAEAKTLAAMRIENRAQLDAVAGGILRVLGYMPEAWAVYDAKWKPYVLYNCSYYSPGMMKPRLRDWTYQADRWLTLAAKHAHAFVQRLPAAERDAAWSAFRAKLLARDAGLDTQGLVRDYRADFDRSDRALNGGAGYSADTNTNGTLAWGEAYLLTAYVEMYRATGDRDYLRRLVAHFDGVLKTRDDVLGKVDAYAGKPLAGWGSERYTHGKWHVWIVHTGMICGGPAAFVRMVAEDRSLQAEFGAKAAVYRARIAECIRDADPYWHDGPMPDEGYYSDPYLDNALPLNQQDAMGIVLIEMYKATGDRAYLDKATRLAHFFHRRLRYNNSDYYDWAYWPKPQDDGSGASEDISHAGINVAFAARCADEGIVFTRGDTGRIARTWLQVVERDNGTWADDIGGGGKGDRYMPSAAADWLLLCPQLLDHVATKLYQNAVRAFRVDRPYRPKEMLGIARLLRFAPTDTPTRR